MREDSFELKSNKYVLTLILNPDVPFQQLLSDIGKKFRRSANFFRGGQMAVSFRGRELSELQETEIVDAITDNCQLDITCIIEDEPEKEERQREYIVRAMSAVREKKQEKEPEASLLTGNMKNGERYTSSRPVVLLGDLEPGAEIISEGSVIVYGVAMGTIRAGIMGDESAVAAALVLKPSLLSISKHTAVSAIRKKEISGEYPENAEAAYLADGHLCFEKISEGALQHAFSALGKEQNQKEAGSSSYDS